MCRTVRQAFHFISSLSCRKCWVPSRMENGLCDRLSPSCCLEYAVWSFQHIYFWWFGDKIVYCTLTFTFESNYLVICVNSTPMNLPMRSHLTGSYFHNIKSLYNFDTLVLLSFSSSAFLTLCLWRHFIKYQIAETVNRAHWAQGMVGHHCLRCTASIDPKDRGLSADVRFPHPTIVQLVIS